MGSFRPAAGNQHLHWYCNFAGPPIETVPKSLLHSCRSELTRQGISLAFFRRFRVGADSIFIRQPNDRCSFLGTRSNIGVQRIVSEDPVRPHGFLRIVQSRAIVTAPCFHRASRPGSKDIPAYSRILKPVSRLRWLRRYAARVPFCVHFAAMLLASTTDRRVLYRVLPRD